MAADVQYVYYSMLELGEFTPEIPLVLELFDRKTPSGFDMTSLHDRDEDGFKNNLNSIADTYYEQASAIEKSLIGYNYILQSSEQMSNLVQKVVLELGDIYLGREKPNWGLLISGNKNTRADVQSGSIRDVMLVESHNKVIQANSKISGYLSQYASKYEKYTRNITHTFQEAMEYYYVLKNGDRENEVLGSFSTEREILERLEGSTVQANAPWHSKKIKKQTRRVFNKSLQGLSRFWGREKVNSFVKGEQFKVEGRKFNYMLKSTGDLIPKTYMMNNYSIQYDLLLYNKDWEYMSKLCVTFPGSPILDQVLSVYLMIQSDQEDELLKSSNFYQRSEKLLQSSEFAKIKGVRDRDDAVSDAIARIGNKSYKEMVFEKKKPELAEKVKRVFVKRLGIPKSVAEELFSQELTFDEKLDYIGLGIPMPTNLDFLAVKEGAEILSV